MNTELYLLVKALHITCAALSISGFCLRALLKFQQSSYLQSRWLRIAPHINDSLLLGCAIYLAISINQYPFSNSWLTAKFIALLIYIGLGMMVMRFAKTLPQKMTAFMLALLSFAYIVAVALSHSPTLGLME